MVPCKAFVVIVIASAVVVLGAVQFVASIAVRAHARPGSWMYYVPAPVAAAVDRLALRVPLPATLRLVLAREALARGEIAQSELLAARLPPSNDRLALAGEFAEARGDVRSAARAYLAAGDVAALDEHVTMLVRRGQPAAALALQTAAIERLEGDRTQRDALAEAYFQLGLLQQAVAYRFNVGTRERRANALRSERAYARAVAIAPLEERYLLALGNQRLNLGQIAAAERTFARARDADPASAAALTGLGEAALRRGDRGTARKYLVRARDRDPGSEAVRRLAEALGT